MYNGNERGRKSGGLVGLRALLDAVSRLQMQRPEPVSEESPADDQDTMEKFLDSLSAAMDDLPEADINDPFTWINRSMLVMGMEEESKVNGQSCGECEGRLGCMAYRLTSLTDEDYELAMEAMHDYDPTLWPAIVNSLLANFDLLFQPSAVVSGLRRSIMCKLILAIVMGYRAGLAARP